MIFYIKKEEEKILIRTFYTNESHFFYNIVDLNAAAWRISIIQIYILKTCVILFFFFKSNSFTSILFFFLSFLSLFFWFYLIFLLRLFLNTNSSFILLDFIFHFVYFPIYLNQTCIVVAFTCFISHLVIGKTKSSDMFLWNIKIL